MTEVFLTLAEVFLCFSLSCKANDRVRFAKTWYGTQPSKLVVIFIVLFYLCCSMYCLCVNVYCNIATGCQLGTNVTIFGKKKY